MAVAIGLIATAGATLGLVSAASPSTRVASRASADPLSDHLPARGLDARPVATTAPTTTTTTATTEPAPAPEPDPPPPPPPTPRPAASGSDAAELLSLVNRFRAAHGVPALSSAADATAKATQHSRDMAAQGQIFHSSSMSSGISGGWTSLGENVGMGSSVSQIESMFEASSQHRANLLNASFNQIGIGVARGSDGALYVTEFFVGR